MPTDLDVARTARNLIDAHGADAEDFALARAKNAHESNREDGASTWLRIAEAVRQLLRRRDR
jgi:hypothetical protein